MERGFWQNLHLPIIGLSPMDGVTDAAFRYIMDTYGKPSLMVTEFTPVEAITHGAIRVMPAFIYHKTATPTMAQVYGTDVDGYYQAAFIVAEMGFDGVDINMGCPDKNISKRGAGAGLIKQPKLAQDIIRSVKKGVKDWYEGKTLEEAGVHEEIRFWIDAFKRTYSLGFGIGDYTERKLLPVSVKTRIGVEEIVTTEWIPTILEMEPANISLHGRTLKQMYTGFADWDEIGKAAELVHKTKTSILGNGDVKSLEEAKQRVADYGVDGVLIGRATYGNPLVFEGKEPDTKLRLDLCREHCRAFMRLTPDLNFYSLRKHLAWYTRGFDGAAEARTKFMQAHSLAEIEEILDNVKV